MAKKIKLPNSYLHPSNLRNTRQVQRLIKEFGMEGYGALNYINETLCEETKHMYPIKDVDLLADQMNISISKLKMIITDFRLFELIIDNNEEMFFSSKLNDWLEPYYTMVETNSKNGKKSAIVRAEEKTKLIENEKNRLSQIDSSQRSLNDCSTNKEINKQREDISIKFTSQDALNIMNNSSQLDQSEISQLLLTKQLNKDMKNSRLQNLYDAQEEIEI